MTPRRKTPRTTCIIPAITTATRNSENENSCNAARTMAARPAAGPLTPIVEPLIAPTTIPPTTPAIRPENNGAPLAIAIPRQRGNATKNTTILAGTSFLRCCSIINDSQSRIKSRYRSAIVIRVLCYKHASCSGLK